MRNSKADQMEGRESMSVPAVAEHLANDPLRQAKVDLAAAHRLAVMYDFEEGIDNHFSVTVPGHDDLFLILPFGLHWAEARASDMIVFDESGTVVDGEGVVELSAYCIHAPIHRITGARVVFHTHQTWALALNMLEDNRIIPASQTSAYFHGRVAYDDAYSGTADFTAEGDRLAEVMGEKQVMFMKNHGVLTVGDTVGQAFRRLYLIERVAKAQVLAMSTGKPLAPISEEMIHELQAPVDHDPLNRSERERLYFDAMKRVLDNTMPGYAE